MADFEFLGWYGSGGEAIFNSSWPQLIQYHKTGRWANVLVFTTAKITDLESNLDANDGEVPDWTLTEINVGTQNGQYLYLIQFQMPEPDSGDPDDGSGYFYVYPFTAPDNVLNTLTFVTDEKVEYSSSLSSLGSAPITSVGSISLPVKLTTEHTVYAFFALYASTSVSISDDASSAGFSGSDGNDPGSVGDDNHGTVCRTLDAESGHSAAYITITRTGGPSSVPVDAYIIAFQAEQTLVPVTGSAVITQHPNTATASDVEPLGVRARFWSGINGAGINELAINESAIVRGTADLLSDRDAGAVSAQARVDGSATRTSAHGSMAAAASSTVAGQALVQQTPNAAAATGSTDGQAVVAVTQDLDTAQATAESLVAGSVACSQEPQQVAIVARLLPLVTGTVAATGRRSHAAAFGYVHTERRGNSTLRVRPRLQTLVVEKVPCRLLVSRDSRTLWVSPADRTLFVYRESAE